MSDPTSTITVQQAIALLTPAAAAALFDLAYRAGVADAQARPLDLVDPALAALREQARRQASTHSERSFTLADLCRREGLPVPPPDDGIAACSVLLRAYRAPRGANRTWTITNTGGRRYRFHQDTPDRVERCNGGTWEETPAEQTPVVVQKVRQALALRERAVGAPQEQSTLWHDATEPTPPPTLRR